MHMCTHLTKIPSSCHTTYYTSQVTNVSSMTHQTYYRSETPKLWFRAWIFFWVWIISIVFANAFLIRRFGICTWRIIVACDTTYIFQHGVSGLAIRRAIRPWFLQVASICVFVPDTDIKRSGPCPIPTHAFVHLRASLRPSLKTSTSSCSSTYWTPFSLICSLSLNLQPFRFIFRLNRPPRTRSNLRYVFSYIRNYCEAKLFRHPPPGWCYLSNNACGYSGYSFVSGNIDDMIHCIGRKGATCVNEMCQS